MNGRDYGLVLAIVAQRANLKGMSLEDIAAGAEKDGLSPIPVWTEAEIREAILTLSWMKFGWRVKEVQSFIDGVVEQLQKGDPPE